MLSRVFISKIEEFQTKVMQNTLYLPQERQILSREMKTRYQLRKRALEKSLEKKYYKPKKKEIAHMVLRVTVTNTSW